jgi:N6-L-threonylcarbamoyladenine synthase
MIILGIETSCDETSASIVKDDKILSNIISSQIDIHKKYGGIVPEIASRKHIEAILPVIKKALKIANISLNDVEGIAVTEGPGLVGSLLVGISVAKGIAYARNIPFIGINHLEGHLLAIFLEDREIDFPYIGLVVSGGHTSLYLVKNFGDYQLLGDTRDDAAGEAFDKIAKFLNLGYPGGVIIDKLSKGGDYNKVKFPRAIISNESFEFSFSGLKTSFIEFMRRNKGEGIELNDILASFQEAIVDVLTLKTFKAASNFRINRVVICGGVASNTRLRENMINKGEELGINVHIPSPILCTDNAAMIAFTGLYYLKRGLTSNYNLNAEPHAKI